MKSLFLWMAVLGIAIALLIGFTLPPRRQTLTTFDDGTVPGVIHIHTNRSDGSSDPDTIAAAAARAGLKFIVFTDHGDATRTPDPPQYRSGVLCLDGVEVSTNGGHYVAIDMPASPYPLRGEARDVVEDVRRLGGFGIAAHPDSPKPQLQWRDWTAPFDAVELLNPDTSWRILAEQAGWRPRWRIAAALFDYPVRPVEVMASLIQPTRALAEWAALAATRRVITIAGADAHAKLAPRNADPGESRWVLPMPSYEASFDVLSIRVHPDGPLTGTAASDARLVMRAIRAGHLHAVVDGLATPASFEFTATNEHGTVHEGDAISAGGGLQLRVRTNAPASFTTVLHEGMRTLAAQLDAQDWTVHAPEKAAVYWVEIVSAGAQPITWLRSNPIYVRTAEPAASPAVRPAPAETHPIFDGQAMPGWRVEHDPTSAAAAELAPIVGGSELRLRYGLAGGAVSGQVAALVYDTPNGIAPNTRLTFTARGERPMRVSVQLRGGEGAGADDRWQRSVYVDAATHEHTVMFDDMTPVGLVHADAPPLAKIRNVMFVIDLTNARPGTSGRFWIEKAALER